MGTFNSAIMSGRMKKTDVIKGKDSPLPAQPGVYRHIDKETGKITYIGQTSNIRRRNQQEACSGQLDPQKQYVAWGVARPGATRDDLLRTEKEHISRHHPEGNTYAGGNGRR